MTGFLVKILVEKKNPVIRQDFWFNAHRKPNKGRNGTLK